jgi:hypothetical protein
MFMQETDEADKGVEDQHQERDHNVHDNLKAAFETYLCSSVAMHKSSHNPLEIASGAITVILS